MLILDMVVVEVVAVDLADIGTQVAVVAFTAIREILET
jgi:hypothetical protein